MKNNDLKNWVQDNMKETHSDIFEKEIMNNLLEYRLKESFKLRLERKRRRMGYIKKGLIGLAIFSILSLSIYYGQSEKPLLSSPSLSENPEAASNSIDLVKHENNIDTTLKSKTISKNAAQTSKQQTDNAASNISSITNDEIKKEPIVYKELAKNEPQNRIFDTVTLYRTSQKEVLPPVFLQKGMDNPISDVRQLDFSKQKLTRIPPSVFEHQNLEILILNKNKLVDLPIELGNLKALQTLSIQNNSLKTIPQSVFQLSNLIKLDLFGNKISNIPIEIAKLSQLENLNLQYNRLHKLPTEMGQLSQLKELDLRNNSFRIYPNSLNELTQLTTLRLSHNILKELPSDIEKLSQLKVLELRMNQLEEIPEEIGNLTELTTLDLSDNKINYLPETIEKLTQLKYLDLRGNPILASELRHIERLLPNCKVDFERMWLIGN